MTRGSHLEFEKGSCMLRLIITQVLTLLLRLFYLPILPWFKKFLRIDRQVQYLIPTSLETFGNHIQNLNTCWRESLSTTNFLTTNSLVVLDITWYGFLDVRWLESTMDSARICLTIYKCCFIEIYILNHRGNSTIYI